MFSLICEDSMLTRPVKIDLSLSMNSLIVTEVILEQLFKCKQLLCIMETSSLREQRFGLLNLVLVPRDFLGLCSLSLNLYPLSLSLFLLKVTSCGFGRTLTSHGLKSDQNDPKVA